MESLDLVIVVPAGANGKLYGAVTNQTVADELNKLDFDIERKRITIPGLTIKSVGKYSVGVHLYESENASVTVVVQSQGEANRLADQAAAAKTDAALAPEAVDKPAGPDAAQEPAEE